MIKGPHTEDLGTTLNDVAKVAMSTGPAVLLFAYSTVSSYFSGLIAEKNNLADDCLAGFIAKPPCNR